MPDFPPSDDVCGALEEHVRRSFPGQIVESLGWDRGPVVETSPHLHVLLIAPTGDGLWTYISVGGWESAREDERGERLGVRLLPRLSAISVPAKYRDSACRRQAHRLSLAVANH